MRHIFLTIALLSLSVQAQNTMPTTFPEGATTPTAAELQARLSGNVYSVKPFSGDNWRLQYKDTGYYYINVGSFSDSGKWNTENGKLCSMAQKSGGSCNEVRATPESIYLKRNSGEVVVFVKE